MGIYEGNLYPKDEVSSCKNGRSTLRYCQNANSEVRRNLSSSLNSDPDGVIGGAKHADKVGNLESVPDWFICVAKHIDEVDNLESDPGGVIGGAKTAHEVGNLESDPKF